MTTTSQKQSVFDVLRSLNIKEYTNRFQDRCPLHGGDNDTAFCYYKDSNIWRCFTHLCHEKWGSGPNGLMRGLNIDCTQVEYDRVIHSQFITERAAEEPEIKVERKTVIQHLDELPSTYFIKRGFHASILQSYDIGTCFNIKSPMYNRAVVPCYEESGQYAIGFSGRDITNTDSKWKHSYGFKKSHYLYNLWKQKQNVLKYQTAILVEGFGDVWKMEEAGVPCCLAIMGTNLSIAQSDILSRLGVMKLILLLDNDPPGETSKTSIYNKYKLLYNISIPKLSYKKDIGDMPVSWVHNQCMNFL